MPEYSSTTLTPTDATKVPGMQGSNAGNFQLDALKAYILAEKAQANGLASLDATGKLVSSQIPDNLDDVLVYGSYALLPATGVEGKIYITADTNSMYRWDASLETPDYVMLAVDLEEYATKAELQAETNQRKASDSRLESRLENLEQKAGDYTTVQYRGTNAVPTGKAKYGLVKSFVGKIRAWNQLISGSSIASDTKGLSITYSNGQFTVSGTTTGTGNVALAEAGDYYSGHVYLLAGLPSGLSGIVLNRFLGTGANITDSGSGAIQTATVDGSDSAKIRLQITAPIGTSFNFSLKPIFRDLTLIFGAGNEPSTVAEALAQLPALGEFNDYDAGSLVDTEVSGVRSKSRNLWDEEWELGRYNTATGQKEEFSLAIRCKNAIEVLPSTDYYVSTDFAISSYGIYLFFYDIDDNYISYAETYRKNFTTPQNAYKLRFRMTTGYGTTYHNNLCINQSDALNGTYTHYMTDTLSLSETVTLRSAGSVAEILTLETGKKTRPIIEFDLGDLEYSTPNEYGRADSTALPSNVKGGLYSYPANAVCAKYLIGNWGDDRNTNGMLIIYQTVSVCDSAFIGKTGAEVKTLLTGVKVFAERITPDTDISVCDPIPDNFIEVEGSGTINTIQEQTPVIDNCLDVGYLTV